MNQKRSHAQSTRLAGNSCRNCGQYGHIYKDCPEPITSFGIICYRVPCPGKIEYLMIQRKDSLSFMEFIRGKFDVCQIDYVGKLLSGMTHDERRMLLETPFEQLWNHVWYQPSIPRHTVEYEHSKAKFDSLLAGFVCEGRRVSLSSLLKEWPSQFAEPEWGFPKGRRKIREDDAICAIREFSEETGFSETDIQLVQDISPFEEIFFGTNNVLYRHIYYVACLSHSMDKPLWVDPSNINQAREVRALEWFNSDDVISHIRTHNHERKHLFMQAHLRIQAHISKNRQ